LIKKKYIFTPKMGKYFFSTVVKWEWFIIFFSFWEFSWPLQSHLKKKNGKKRKSHLIVTQC
jgi:hypothetical protein